MAFPDRQRDLFVAKLNEAKRELATAGCIHKKDLQRQIKRMERELSDYDRFHGGSVEVGKREKS